MKLGTGTTADDNILTATKWLDELPVGSVIRNGCDSKADPHADGTPVYFVKVAAITYYAGACEWQWADPATYLPIGHPLSANVVFRARDVFLPVQVMRRGPAKLGGGMKVSAEAIGDSGPDLIAELQQRLWDAWVARDRADLAAKCGDAVAWRMYPPTRRYVSGAP